MPPNENKSASKPFKNIVFVTNKLNDYVGAHEIR